jgi:fibronectin type 3 domain-containing protein
MKSKLIPISFAVVFALIIVVIATLSGLRRSSLPDEQAATEPLSQGTLTGEVVNRISTEASGENSVTEQTSAGASTPGGKETDPSGAGATPITFGDAVLPRVKGDRFAAIIANDTVALDYDLVSSLFTAAVGDPVTLPLNPPVKGTVNMNHLHENGDIALGIQLSDFDGATAMLALAGNGEIQGTILSKNSGTAFKIEHSNDITSLRMKREIASNILCAKVEDNRLYPGLIPSPADPSEAAPQGITQNIIPILNSKPGAAKTIYLDFDGETVTGTGWNASKTNGDPIVVAAYGNQNNIQGIWEVMAEDFFPFDVNVTTSRAVYDAAASGNKMMVIFTPDKDWYGSAGGVAYLNSFGTSYNYCCWVFNSGLNGAAEAGSHEVGHTVSLRHDGTSALTYYSGHTYGSGVSWGPIMGASYGRSIVQFSKGEYPDANNQENDFDLIDNFLPYRPDDHGDTSGNATVISSAGQGSISQTGIIATETDVDVFRFVADKTGTISLSATAFANYRNLDIKLELLNSGFSVINTNEPAGPYDASISATSQPAGTYYIRVSGSGLGNLTTGYGKYGSVGRYALTGSYPFTIVADPPTNLSASDGTSTAHVAVTWDAMATATGYRLYRGLSSNSSASTLIAGVSTTSFLDTSAVYETVYYYFVESYNAQGTSTKSPGETGFRDLPIPQAPTNLSASQGTSSLHVAINWDVTDAASAYRVYRGITSNPAASTLLGEVTGTEYFDTTATYGSSFYYFVEAINVKGSSAKSAGVQGFRRLPVPLTPTGLTASDGSSTANVAITWNSVANAGGYRIFRSLSNSSTGAGQIGTITSGTSLSDTGGQPGTVYYYFVSAYNTEGESPRSSGESGYKRLPIPSTPTGVSGSTNLSDYIRVNWNSSANSHSYRIYRNTINTTVGAVEIGASVGTSYDDTTTSPGQTFYYFVQGSNSEGNSSLGTGTGNDGVRKFPQPGIPLNLTATDGSSPQYTALSWTQSSQASGYYVFRNTVNSTTNGSQIGMTTTETSFLDMSGIAGETYFYYVKSYNADWTSAASNTDDGFREAVPPMPPSPVNATQRTFPTSVRVTWSATAETTGYQVYRGTTENPEEAAFIKSQTSTQWLDNAAQAGRTYYYFVKSENSIGASDFSEVAVGFGSASDSQDDALENNETLTTAYPLFDENEAPMEDINVKVSASDPDWFEVRTGVDDVRLDVVALLPPTSSPVSLTLFDEFGTSLAEGAIGAGNGVISFPAVGDQSYFIRVTSDATSFADYNLLWKSLDASEHGISVDGAIGRSVTSLIGTETINPTGAGQIISASTKSTGALRAYVRSENRSAVNGDFILRSRGGSSSFGLTVMKQNEGEWENVTASAILDGVSTTLSPFQTSMLEIRASPKAPKTKTVSTSYQISTSLAGDEDTVDTVIFKTTKVGQKKKKKR